ncbi:MAG: M48 family metallopeptidase [Burkholderiales bacterium]|nr:M48 family metallopeptidase [Burkholderiales bacterium]
MAGPDDDAIDALWFDGLGTRPRPVTVRVGRGPDGPELRVDVPGEPTRTVPGRDVDWPSRWSARGGPARLTVGVRGLGSLQVARPDAWQRACDAAGLRPGLAALMQTRWSVLLGVAALCVVFVLVLHRFGMPWVSERVARHVPLDWELAISDEVLKGRWLAPSRLPAERREALHAAFDTLRGAMPAGTGLAADYVPRLELHLRRGIGPNALALPGGAVVLTDELVERAAELKLPDDALLGVLAHEIGHVMHRHGTRMVVEQAVMNVGLALALGDLSTLTTTAASAVAGLAYSRGHESQADCFAIAMMTRAGRPTGPMADLLLDLGRQHGDSGGSDWLSSHPSTPARAERLRAAVLEDCGR